MKSRFGGIFLWPVPSLAAGAGLFAAIFLRLAVKRISASIPQADTLLVLGQAGAQKKPAAEPAFFIALKTDELLLNFYIDVDRTA